MRHHISGLGGLKAYREFSKHFPSNLLVFPDKKIEPENSIEPADACMVKGNAFPERLAPETALHQGIDGLGKDSADDHRKKVLAFLCGALGREMMAAAPLSDEKERSAAENGISPEPTVAIEVCEDFVSVLRRPDAAFHRDYPFLNRDCGKNSRIQSLIKALSLF